MSTLILESILRRLRELVDGGMTEGAFSISVDKRGEVCVKWTAWDEGYENSVTSREIMPIRDVDDALFGLIAHATMKTSKKLDVLPDFFRFPVRSTDG